MAGEGEKETVGVARWLVTLGAIGLYFVGGHVPLPGVDAPALGGEAAPRLSLFALGVMPIISGLVLLEIARLAIPPFAHWAVKGPRQAQTYARVARGRRPRASPPSKPLGIAAALEGANFAIDEAGWPFRLEIVLLSSASTACLCGSIDMINAKGSETA